MADKVFPGLKILGVSALPVAGAKGRLRFLLSDGHLYCDNGTSWDDLTASSGGGGGFFGTFIVDFGNDPFNAQETTVDVADAGVSAGSKIAVQIAGPADGRDADEMEMESFAAAVSSVNAGIGFSVVVNCVTGGAHGSYNLNYSR